MVDQFAILPRELQHPLTEVGSRLASIHDLVAADRTGDDFSDDLFGPPGYERLAYLTPT
jgi:hypothetical protein